MTNSAANWLIVVMLWILMMFGAGEWLGAYEPDNGSSPQASLHI